MKCGDCIKVHRKSELTPGQMYGLPEWDRDIPKEWSQRRNQRYQELRAEAEAAEKQDWDSWYASYLLTPEWQRRRKLVMQRSKGMCEGCLTRPAVQVHHLTYDRVGKEMLF